MESPEPKASPERSPASSRARFRLLAISSGRAHLGGSDRSSLLRWLGGLAGLGPELAVQLREKGLDDRATFELAVEARSIFPGTFLVNGRADLALAAAADGVHLTSRGPATESLARRFGRDLLVGRSTHGVAELAEHARFLDYACVGPLFPTPSKPGALPLDSRDLADASRLPTRIFALGGIDDVERARAAVRAGAGGVAGIRLFSEPARLPPLVRELSDLWAELERIARGGAGSSGRDCYDPGS